MKDKVIVISGPTASGKTALAVLLAKKFNGEIISADSRQVYKGLDIGTGKDLEEYGKVKYHLIDICKPGEKFTLFDWLPLARKKIDELVLNGKLPIVVGGTGLYIKALVDGYEISDNRKIGNLIKKLTRKYLDMLSPERLVKILSKLDPETLKKIDQKNSRRIVRAIEIAREKSIAKKSGSDFDFLQIAIDLPREKLYKRIDARADNRFEQGMLEEVEGLLKKKVSKKWLLSLGLEYRIIGSYLLDKKSMTYEQVVQELKWKSHAYARRQLTWLRHQSKTQWIKNKNQAQKIVKEFLK